MSSKPTSVSTMKRRRNADFIAEMVVTSSLERQPKKMAKKPDLQVLYSSFTDIIVYGSTDSPSTKHVGGTVLHTTYYSTCTPLTTSSISVQYIPCTVLVLELVVSIVLVATCSTPSLRVLYIQ